MLPVVLWLLNYSMCFFMQPHVDNAVHNAHASRMCIKSRCNVIKEGDDPLYHHVMVHLSVTHYFVFHSLNASETVFSSRAHD